ncbi:MAG: response regulator [Cyanobacteriota bacterium]|nr:response regulator [Cyanobacteriota bacterium]
MKTVLVVEDGQTERQVATGLLSQAGFSVETVGTAEDAWQWLQNHTPPNLILLDIVMPGQSGLELCRMIRSEAHLAQVPIVFCSSKNEQFDKFWAMRQGGNAYITKPYAPKELLETVYQYVQ